MTFKHSGSKTAELGIKLEDLLLSVHKHGGIGFTFGEFGKEGEEHSHFAVVMATYPCGKTNKVVQTIEAMHAAIEFLSTKAQA